MNKVKLFLTCTLLIFASTQAVKAAGNQSTCLVSGRWELFMSEIAARNTFRIDKWTGMVFQLVERENGTLTWNLVTRQASINDTRNQNAINYQMFTSGIAVRFTFLININTGVSWQLVEDRYGRLLFELID